MDARPFLTYLSEEERASALDRFHLLQPHLEEGVPLPQLARAHEVPLRTARRWVARYRRLDLPGLVRKERLDQGTCRFPPELAQLAEGLALRRPPPSAASVHRQIVTVARERGWQVPSYSTIYSLIRNLDQASSRSHTKAPRRIRSALTCSTDERSIGPMRSGSVIIRP